jgi:prolipoprotein diacylglyceryltransferase
VYPVLFRIGSFDITSFGVLVALGAFVGLWLFQREAQRSGSARKPSTRQWPDAGGLAGAKLLWS